MLERWVTTCIWSIQRSGCDMRFKVPNKANSRLRKKDDRQRPLSGVLFGGVPVGPVDEPMVLEYDTSLDTGTTISLPLAAQGGSLVDVEVDWGDGNIESFTTTGSKDHTYASEGTYTVTITGDLDQYGDFGASQPMLTACTSFGTLGISSLFGAFHGASNMTVAPDNLPSTVTQLAAMFKDCTSFNYDVSGWDVSNVTGANTVFENCTVFNQPIGAWDTSSFTTMSGVFRDASSFNQDLSSWDTGGVSSFTGIFDGAVAFDQNIGSWNIASLGIANDMFLGVALSTTNYDALLVGWEGQAPVIQDSVSFHGGNSTYSAGSAAETARTNLINTYSWTITDGGSV